MALIYKTQQLTEVYANSGYWADIQNAVDQAALAGGGNVHVPEGKFDFVLLNESWIGTKVMVPAGVNIYGAPTERDANDQVVEWKTILVMPWDVPGAWGQYPPWWFSIQGNSDPSKPSRFSDIKLVGYRSLNPNSTTIHLGIQIQSVIDFRIDHNCIENVAGRGIGVEGLYCCGVIDHNRLYNTHGWDDLANYVNGNIGYGVMVTRAYSGVTFDPTMEVLGKYTNYTVFIEDNYFSRWRHLVSSGHGGHYVFRYNLVDGDFAHYSMDVHGLRDTETGRAGTRAAEIYENIFRNVVWQDDSPSGGSQIKGLFQNGGGCGVWFNNYVDNTYQNIALYKEDYVASETWHLKDFYFWGAKGNWAPNFNGIPSGFTVDRNVLADWNRQAGNPSDINYPNTNPAWSIAGYKPYTYPHPLTLNGEPQLPTTPFLSLLEEAAYRISMPHTVTTPTPTGNVTYAFKQWEDGSTNPERTINLTADTIITAVYELAEAPPTPPLAIAPVIEATAGLILTGIALS